MGGGREGSAGNLEGGREFREIKEFKEFRDNP